MNLHEFEAAARELLSNAAFDYIAGGSGDGSTLRNNRDGFDRLKLVPHVLRGGSPEIRTTVLGQEISLPVMLAPVGFHRLAHGQGENASAEAARKAGTVFVLSTASTTPLEEVAGHAGDWWFQIYVFRDREVTRHLIHRAEEAGAKALVITVDTPRVGRREADERNRFALPEGLTWANFLGTEFSAMAGVAEGSGLAAYIASAFDSTLSWTDIDWLASVSRLPIVLKGILRGDDAGLAVEHGARAIIVSNHGGRQLDSVIGTIDALPAVVEAVAGRSEIYLDGGVRRGTDVLKALAHGARAVLIGRPFVWGLAVGGAQGVAAVLELLRAELRLDMALAGYSRLEEVGPELIASPAVVR